MDEITYLPESRKFKTLSSIPQSSEDFQVFKNYIEIEQILFSHVLYKGKEEINQEINSILQQNIDKIETLLHYLIKILMHFVLIRPKQRDIPYFLYSELLKNFESKIDLFKSIYILDENYIHHTIFEDFLYDLGIFEQKPFNYSERTDTSHEDLEHFLQNDDIDQLKQYINSRNELKEEIYIDNDDDPPIWEVLDTFNLYSNRDFSMLDFCSFYGSVQCFRFLKMNGYNYGVYIKEMSIAGGNIEIIHEIEQDGISFDDSFELSVKYHHKTINEWLLSNYKCEVISLTKYLQYYDYHTFLFLLFNSYDINQGSPTPLEFLCNQQIVNTDVITLLIDRGADINNGKITPLEYLCMQERINSEAIKLLIDRGANVNKGKIPPLGLLCFQHELNFEAIRLLILAGSDINMQITPVPGCSKETPLGFLCKHENTPIDLILLLLERGADVNTVLVSFPYVFNLLVYLFFHKQYNIELIQDLIDRGADVNKECKKFINRDLILSYTPLEILCKQNIINFEAVKLLINRGAYVNKGDFTPLGYLCNQENVNLELIQYLIDKGADVNKECKEYINRSSFNAFTPLEILCKQKTVNIDAIKLLIDKGANVNKGKTTPLGYLCKQENINIEAIKLLIDSGADINKGDIPPLGLLCDHDIINIDAIKLLIDKGANVNKSFNHNFGEYSSKCTSLGILCKQKNINKEAIKLLIDSGADVSKCENLPPLD